MIISQLFTQKRLLLKDRNDTLYKPSYDPAAVQFVLNMIAEAGKE